ncbi:MAG TPA: PKD domain-containing protein, partial [Flavisolibacter sp.]|nr:PKD domain-containing protein [Flavisolibacter sp.]
AWDFGDGGTSTVQNPTHTYTSQGTYTVTLTITTSTGCTEVYTLPDAVKAGTIPNTNFSATPLNACASQAIRFKDLTDIADAWTWDFGDGKGSSSQNPSHTYEDTGYFNIALTAINNGCAKKISFPNYVHIKPPIANFAINATCVNKLEFDFADASIGAQTWSWDFGDGATSTIKNPRHVYSDYGTYTVTLTVTNDTCSSTIKKKAYVFNENPDFRVSDTAVCKKNTIQFFAIVADPLRFRNYLWDFGDGTRWNSADHNSGGNANHYYPNPGWYTVTLTTRDINHCVTVVSKRIRINGPKANFSALNTNGCKGLTTTFNDLSQSDGVNNIVNKTWDFGDGT